MRNYLFILICLFALSGFAQTNQDPKETDTLGSRVVFYIPTADNDKLTLIKNQLSKYSQIQSAVFIYQNHNTLLIDLADVIHPTFLTYADLIKLLAHGITSDEIFIKTPAAYDEIIGSKGLDSTTFILK